MNQKKKKTQIPLNPAAAKRVELALHPRTETLARRFSPEDIAKWKSRAKTAKMQMTDWMKMKLDA